MKFLAAMAVGVGFYLAMFYLTARFGPLWLIGAIVLTAALLWVVS